MDNRARAQQLFDSALADAEAGNLAAACPKFLASQEADPRRARSSISPAATRRTARPRARGAPSARPRCLARKVGHTRLGDLARAATPRPSSQARAAHRQVPEPSRVPELVVIARRTGSRGEWGVAIPVDPGEHVVAALGRRTRAVGDAHGVREASATVAVPVLEPLAGSGGRCRARRAASGQSTRQARGLVVDSTTHHGRRRRGRRRRRPRHRQPSSGSSPRADTTTRELAARTAHARVRASAVADSDSAYGMATGATVVFVHRCGRGRRGRGARSSVAVTRALRRGPRKPRARARPSWSARVRSECTDNGEASARRAALVVWTLAAARRVGLRWPPSASIASARRSETPARTRVDGGRHRRPAVRGGPRLHRPRDPRSPFGNAATPAPTRPKPSTWRSSSSTSASRRRAAPAGFNLDHACSPTVATSTCTTKIDEATFAKYGKDLDDKGLDNAGFGLLGYLAYLGSAFAPKNINERLQGGEFGAVVRIANWNGTSEDDDVIVEVFPAIGVWNQPDGGASRRPAASPRSRRPTSGCAIVASRTSSMLAIKSANAWVTGGRLVASFQSVTLPVTVPDDTKPLDIILQEAFFSGMLVVDGASWKVEGECSAGAGARPTCSRRPGPST